MDPATYTPPLQELPPWLSYSTEVIIDPTNGLPTITRTVVPLPLTYYGPSIPLGTDTRIWVYGGSTPPTVTPTVSASASLSGSVLPSQTATTVAPTSTPTPPPTSAPTSAPISATIPTPSTSTSTAGPIPAGNSHLSNGAIAGIVIGSVLFLLALLGCCLVFFTILARRRRQQRQRHSFTSSGGPLDGSDPHFLSNGEGWLLLNNPPGYTTDYNDIPPASEKKQQRAGTLRSILQKPPSQPEVEFPSPESFPPPPHLGGALETWPEEPDEEDIGDHRSMHGVIGGAYGPPPAHEAHSRSQSHDTTSSPAPDPFSDPSPRSSLFVQSPSGPPLWSVPPAPHDPVQSGSPPFPDSPASERDEGARLLPFPSSPPRNTSGVAIVRDSPPLSPPGESSWSGWSIFRRHKSSSATVQPPSEKERVPSPAPTGTLLGGIIDSISRASRSLSRSGDPEVGWSSQEKIRGGSGVSLPIAGGYLSPGAAGPRDSGRPPSSGHSSYHDAPSHPSTPPFPAAHPYIRSHQPRTGSAPWLPVSMRSLSRSPSVPGEESESSIPTSWPRPPGIRDTPSPHSIPRSRTPLSSIQGPPPSYSRDPLDDRPPVPMPVAISIIRGHTEQDVENLRRQREMTEARHERLGFNRMGTSLRSFQMLSQPETDDGHGTSGARTPPNLDDGNLATVSPDEDLDLQQPPPSLLSSRSTRNREGSEEYPEGIPIGLDTSPARVPPFQPRSESLDSVHQDIRRGNSEEYIPENDPLTPMHFVVHSSSEHSSTNAPSDFVPLSPHSDDSRSQDPPSLSALTAARPRDTVMSTASAHADQILNRAELSALEILGAPRRRPISNGTAPSSVTSGGPSSVSSVPSSPAVEPSPLHSVGVRHSMSALGGSRLSSTFDPARPTSDYLAEAEDEDEDDVGEHDHEDDRDDEDDRGERAGFLRPRGLPSRSHSPMSPYHLVPHSSGPTPPPPLSALGSEFPGSPPRFRNE